MMLFGKSVVIFALSASFFNWLSTSISTIRDAQSNHIKDDLQEAAIDWSTDEDALRAYSFDEFVKDHRKSYATAEEHARRAAIYAANIDAIVQHNAQPDRAYTLAVNAFADLEEWELPMGHDKFQSSQFDSTPKPGQADLTAAAFRMPFRLGHKTATSELPESVDWRTQPGVTGPVKNQGGCGSCWAFAATAVLESHIAIATGILFTLSVQEFVSCAPNPNHCGGTGGCSGSTVELAYAFAALHGVAEEWSFGYSSGHGADVACTILPEHDKQSRALGARAAPSDHRFVNSAVASIVGFANLPSNDYYSLMATVAHVGPVAVSVAASGWSFYHGGIFDDESRQTRDINHAVVLEGYGTDEETGADYWLVRNSWGPTWGEKGYIRLKRVNPEQDPEADCRMDFTPSHGDACTLRNGTEVVPKPIRVCGTSGILHDSVVPVGGHLL
uniref:Peptidase C1A papain C-terminal domain-containing protein n=1 Tax=Craspedostauros australis TaxID=1486917 RepID=A0A7R9WTZ8_9STRA